jgi:hypothetical protein
VLEQPCCSNTLIVAHSAVQSLAQLQLAAVCHTGSYWTIHFVAINMAGPLSDCDKKDKACTQHKAENTNTKKPDKKTSKKYIVTV